LQAGFETQLGAYELLKRIAGPGDSESALIIWSAEL